MPRLPCASAALLIALALVLPLRAEKNLQRPPGTTRYAAMVGQLRALNDYDKAHAGRMTLTTLGKSVRGRDLWMITLHEGSKEPTPQQVATLPVKEGEDKGGGNSPDPSSLTGKGVGGLGSSMGRTIFYLCRQHGHEPASTEGALAFINTLVKAGAGTLLADDLKRVTVYVVPMANPDGSEAYLRHNAHDVDLNRDWLRRTQPETRALYAAIQRLHPDLMTDQHELYPNDPRPDFTETAGPGSGARPDLIQECDQTQNSVQGAMLAEGFPSVCHLITDTHPARLAHRFGCVVACIPTILFETNRLSGSGRAVAARAAAQEQFMMTIFRDQAGERDKLLAEAATWQTSHAAAIRPVAATPPKTEKGSD